MVPIGPLCVMYVDTAFDFTTPTWVDAEGVNEFSADKKWSTPDVRSRRSRVDEVKKTRFTFTATGTYLVDPLDPIYVLLAEAVDGDYSIDLLILNAAKDTPGARGIRAWCSINGGTEQQGPDDIVYMAFELRPAAERPLADKPQRAVVSTGATPTLEFSDFGLTTPPPASTVLAGAGPDRIGPDRDRH